jgi:O-antigen ligase
MVFTDYIKVILYFFIYFKLVDSVEKTSKVLLIGCLGNGLYTFFSIINGNFSGGRLHIGDMFDPNDLSFFTLSFIPLNLIFVFRKSSIWIKITCLFFFSIGILLIMMTGSRGGFVAIGGVTVFFIFSKSRIFKASLKIVLIVVCITITSLSSINWERYLTLLELEEDYNLQDETGRIGIWKIGIRAMIENPISGTGVDTFPIVVGKDREKRNLPTQKWQVAHNMIVQIGTETGVVGLTLFMILSINILRIFTKVIKNSQNKELSKICEMGRIGFLGLFISGMFLSQAYSIYWAFYVVLSAGVNRLMLREQKVKAVLGCGKNIQNLKVCSKKDISF